MGFRLSLAILFSLILACREGFAYTEAEIRSAAVELRATVSATVPRVILHWNASSYTVTGQSVYRRVPGEVAWEFSAALSPSALSWADTTAADRTLYEYRVERGHSSPFGAVTDGWVRAGMGVPAVEDRGRLVLVVDETMASPLAHEIQRLVVDLVGDGWTVARADVSRSATPPQVKDAIRGRYLEDPGPTRVVLLLGRVPVPYSGLICPDGHWDPPPLPHHRGAWPTDAYYGDMDGVWTDSSVNYTAANVDGTRNHNTPGDGKFDVSLLVGEHLPELVVGRIDLANMGGAANGLSETELLRRYLNRHHAFRHRLGGFATLGKRALVDDEFFGPNWGFPVAAGGWASGVALFGAENTFAGDWGPDLHSQDYLVAYGCGPGSFTEAGGVSTSAAFRDTRCRAVFNLLFGSFFGDWDSPDNFLRAPLVGRADSHGLVSVWSGHPNYALFPLAAGGTFADVYRHAVFEVNQPDGPFPPDDDSWTNPDQCHVAIMGDPVLRSHPVKPVTGLSANLSGNEATLTWTNPAGENDLLGCLVFRAPAIFGPYTRVGERTASGATSFVDRTPSSGVWHYQVRAVKLETTASATYENTAQGVFAEVAVAPFGYAAWSAGLANPGETVDSNGDGITNLLAYAIGADNGMQRAAHLMPRVTDAGGFEIAWSGRGELVYEVEMSLDLIHWFKVARKPPGGEWALNGASGYLHQANLSLFGGTAKTILDSTPAVSRFWRLWVGL